MKKHKENMTVNERLIHRTKIRVNAYEESLARYDKRRRYIGTSLSACVRDMLSGVMPLNNVAGIISNTAIKSMKQLKEWAGAENFEHPLTKKGYNYEELVAVFDHLMFKSVFMQWRVLIGEYDGESQHNPWTESKEIWMPVNSVKLNDWLLGVRPRALRKMKDKKLSLIHI